MGKSKLVFFTLIIVLGLLSLSVHSITLSAHYDDTADVKPSVSNIAPIFIDDLSPTNNWQKYAQAHPWCTGSGIATDPYIITNVVINSEDSNCITIQNSNVHFFLGGCRLTNSEKNGISLLNVNNGMLVLNLIEDNLGSAIVAIECANLLIYENKIYDNKGYGIYAFKCEDVDIVYNSLERNGLCGISVLECDNTDVSHNQVYFHEIMGIEIGKSDYTELAQNSISNHSDGIYCYESRYTTIDHNNISGHSEFGILLQYNCKNTTIAENLFEYNRFCMGISECCSGNNIYNNSACHIYYLDSSFGPPPFTEDELNSLLDNNSTAIPGYSLVILLGTLFFLLFSRYKKLNRARRIQYDFYV